MNVREIQLRANVNFTWAKMNKAKEAGDKAQEAHWHTMWTEAWDALANLLNAG